VQILSTFRDPDDPDPAAHYIALLDGTSMAAPHVAGIAALLESCTPSLTRTDKFNLIINNTDPYNDSRNLGSGIANAKKALDAAGCTGVSCDIVADFASSAGSGCATLAVSFNDLSTGTDIDTWSWDFGDGNGSSSQNPSHTYASAGTYTVSLASTNACGSDGETKVSLITVSDPPASSETLVFDIVVDRENLGQGFKRGRATITIQDNAGNPVANATVTGDFSGKTNEAGISGVTDGNGVVVLFSSSEKGGGEWCFEVTNVTHPSLTYNSALNNVTQSCEGSDVF